MAKVRYETNINNNINTSVHVDGKEELKQATEYAQSLEKEIATLGNNLSQARSEIEMLQDAVAKAERGSGLTALREQLETFKDSAYQAAEEYMSFLKVVRLSDEYGDTSSFPQLERYYENIKNGAMTTQEAIVRVKGEYSRLITEFQSGNGADSQVLQQLDVTLSKLSQTMDTVLTKVTEIQTNGVNVAGSLGNVSTAGNEAVNTINALRSSFDGVDGELNGTYEALTNLANALTQYANVDEGKLISIAHTFKEMGTITSQKFGDKSINNLMTLLEKLSLFSQRAGSISLNLTGFDSLSGLKVSAEGLHAIADCLPKLNEVNADNLQKIASIDWKKFSEVKSLKKLSDIDLSKLKLTKDNINSLEKLKSINFSKISDGLAKLKVPDVDLSKLKLSAVNIAQLKEFANIDWSNVARIPVQNIEAVAVSANNIQSLVGLLQKSITTFNTRTSSNSEAKNINAQTSAMKEAKAAIVKYKEALDSLGQYSGTSSYAGLEGAVTGLESIRAEIEALDPQSETFSSDLAKLRQEMTNLASGAKDSSSAMEKLRAAERALSDETAKSAKDNIASNNALKQGTSLVNQMEQALVKYSAAKTKDPDNYREIKNQADSMRSLCESYEKGEITLSEFRVGMSELNSDFRKSTEAIYASGSAMKTFGERIQSAFKAVLRHYGPYQILFKALSSLRDGVTNSKEIESSLAQLQIVTGATDVEMSGFFEHASAQAKELGSSITDMLGSFETFSRLGYSLSDSGELSKAATILSNVANTDLASATTGLTSIIKGFNVSVEDSEHVADVLVNVGQKYAISASELMEAFEKSGAAFAATDVSFEKAAAILAAGNAAVQDASTVGTALKTVSARIRKSTAELEEMGESTEDLAEGFSKYADEIQQLSGVSILKEGTTDDFKDLFDIFTELSAVWDSLSETSQARISEILGGTRQLQVISSIMGNWGDAVSAYSTAMDSAGAATKANEVYMDTTEAKLKQLQATFQEFSAQLFDSNLMKEVVDMGINFVEILEQALGLVDKIGGIKLILTGILGLVVAFKAQEIVSSVQNFAKEIAGLPKKLSSLVTSIISMVNAENTATVATTGLSTALSGMLGVIGLATTAATLFVQILSSIMNSTNELYELNSELVNQGSSAGESADNILALSDKYLELSASTNETESNVLKLTEAERDLADALGTSKNALDAAKESQDGYNNAVSGGLERAISSARTAYNEVSKIGSTLNTKIYSGIFDNNISQMFDELGFSEGLDTWWRVFIGDVTNNRETDLAQGFNLSTLEGLVGYAEKLSNAISELEKRGFDKGEDTSMYDIFVQRYNEATEAISQLDEAAVNLNKTIIDDKLFNGEWSDHYNDSAEDLMAFIDQLAEYRIDEPGGPLGGYKMFEGSVDDAKAAIISSFEASGRFIAFSEETSEALSEESSELEKLQKNIQNSKSKYHSLTSQLYETLTGKTAYDDATQRTARSIIEEMNTVQDEIKNYALLEQQLLGTTKAFDEYAAAKEKDATSDYTDDVADMISGLFSSFENGEYGTAAFKTAFDALIPSDIYGQFTDAGDKIESGWNYINDKLSRYYTNDDGNISVGLDNIINFASDALDIGAFTGTIDDFQISDSITSIEDLADAMGVTTEVAFALGNAISKYTTDNQDFLSSLSGEGLSKDIADADANLASLLVHQNELIASGQVGTDEWNNTISAIIEAKQAVNELGSAAVDNVLTNIDLNNEIDETWTKLNSISDTLKSLSESGLGFGDEDYDATFNEYTELADKLADLMAQKQELGEPTDLVITASTDAIQGEIDSILEKLQEIASFDGVTWTANVSADQAEVDNYVARIQELNNEKTTIETYAEIDDSDVIDSLEAIQEFDIDDKSFTVGVANYQLTIDRLENIRNKLSSIQSKSVTVSVGTNNAFGSARAFGSAHAHGKWGVPSDEDNALVGELGEELIVDPKTGMYSTVGEAGAEMVDIPQGAIIFNHKQTEGLLKNKRINSRGHAYLSGNAHFSLIKPYSSSSSGNSSSSSSSYSDYSSGSGSGSSGGSSGSSSNASSEFERLYKYHKHLVEMDAEETTDFLNWLNSAYKAAYNNNEIELDDYYKYEEEVYSGLKNLFQDYLGDVEHQIKLYEYIEADGKRIIEFYNKLISDVEKEIKDARSKGLDEADDYIQQLETKWMSYNESVKSIREEAEKNAESSLDSLIDYVIKMNKAAEDSHKDSLNNQLSDLKDFYDKQKKMLEDEYKEEEYIKEQAEKRKNVSDIESQIEMLGRDTSAAATKKRLELEAELADANAELADFEADHARELAESFLDDEYEKQAALINSEIDAIEKALNDPYATFNQALTDIKNNTGGLRDEMIEYNRKYGTGNDKDATSVYDSASKSLTDYKNTNGASYMGVNSVGSGLADKAYNGGWYYFNEGQIDTGYNGIASNINGSWLVKNGAVDFSANTVAYDGKDWVKITSGKVDSSYTGWASNSHGTWYIENGKVNFSKSNNGAGPTNQATSNTSATSSSSTLTNAIKQKVAAAIWNGSLGWGNGDARYARLEEVFGKNNGIQALVNNEVGRYDYSPDVYNYSYLAMRKKFKGYASGTRNATNGLHEVYEDGKEIIFTSASGSKYKMFDGGEKVFDAKATNFLYDISKNGALGMRNLVSGALIDGIKSLGGVGTTINMGDIVIQGNADDKTVSEIRRAQRENVDYILKSFKRLSK